ncbi:hypothetical protein PVE_R2G0087 [Pseudomonas veronii 1YdBTEX2]|uniref:Uncharacterized protein n=1 Tax=Pseudomonas veronii 1YdBTEX2 TaxID=1295141 RepID=A0A1D3K719_PSEVE|nr:hypothetical protein PVE_R2G0087 [Pseudomonas veronii 1YdBTEX2]
MNSRKVGPASSSAPQPKLTKDQFIALRSLARGRWVQSNEIAWKFNRSWRYVQLSNISLEAVHLLQIRGLAIKGKCCWKCRRNVYLLTEAGLKFVTHANTPIQHHSAIGGASITKPSVISRMLYWLGR